MIMNLEELKARHPRVYQSAKTDGARGERSRAVAHLTMGEKSGDLKTALASIRSGADLTIDLQSVYLSAAMNHGDTMVRQAESDEAEAVFENAKRPAGTHVDEHGEAVVSRLEELLGVTDVDGEEASEVTCRAPRPDAPVTKSRNLK
jgi:hypothetical protein